MKDRVTDESPTGFESSIAFRPLRVRTAAVYCSDGRFGEQIDEFLSHLLGSALCDRLALPGGPASLRADPGLPDDSKGTLDQLSFLVGVHEVQQVILIAHEPCAFYRERLGVPDVDQHDRQVEDLRAASRVVGRLAPLTVDLYTARLVGERVHFRAVDS
jgi:hypothetical protein